MVAGVPPDAFTEDGQLWGNPLYDWSALRADGFRWWIERFRRTFELVDLTRADHFRGFVAYWAVPADAATARSGQWRRAPGRKLFDAVRAELGDLPVIAEDLGVITPAVERLRDELGPAGDARAAVGLLRPPHEPAPPREPSREWRRVHGHARQRHDGRVVVVAERGASAQRPASTRRTPRGR